MKVNGLGFPITVNFFVRLRLFSVCDGGLEDETAISHISQVVNCKLSFICLTFSCTYRIIINDKFFNL